MDSAMGPLLSGFVDALSPVTTSLRDPSGFVMLLRRIDPDLALPDPTLGGAIGPGGAVTEAADAIDAVLVDAADAIDHLTTGTPEQRAQAVIDLAEDIQALLAAIEAVADAVTSLDLGGLGLPPAQQDPSYWAGLFAGVPAQLLMTWLEAELPALHGLLLAVAVIEEDDRRIRRLHPDRLIDVVGDPFAHARTLTGWASGQIDADGLAGLVSDAGTSLGLDNRISPLRPEVAELVGRPQPVDARAIELPVVSGMLPAGAGYLEAGAIVAAVASNGPWVDALLVTNLAAGEVDAEIELNDTWTLHLEGGANQTAMAGVLVGLDGIAAVTRAGGTAFALRLEGTPGTPWRPLGTATGTRLTVAGADVRVAIEVAPTPDVIASAALHDAELVVVAGDGLLRTIVGDELRIPLDLEVALSRDGLVFGSSVGLALWIPLNLTIGPVTITGVDLGVLTDPVARALVVEAGGSLTGTFGPFAVSLDGLGVALGLTAGSDGRGTLGPFDVDVGFLPPHGFGLSIEAPLTSGGGRLSVDPDAGRYEGALSLDIAEVGIDAVLVIDTKVSVEPGWAFFGSLSAQFPGIPLGFGFSLTGVGGVLALNRAVDAEALALALRDGAADAILFPANALQDAELLIGQLDDFFPLAGGNTVIGPIIEIGWGAPIIITGQLGVLVSIPQGVITLLGSLEVTLPTPEEAVLELHLDLLGSVDLPNGTLLVVASLYDSRLLGFIELSGDAAMYLAVSGNPYFVLSVGGFHPGFEPPSYVPSVLESLREMRAEITVGLGVTATLTSYFAVTSNTVQFGGGFEIEASAEFLLVTYTARGWFEFDVLIRFSPFLIIADAAAGVGVYTNTKELMGVDLSVHLEGPEPWYASGTARFTFFGVKVKFDFDVGGHAPNENPGTADVLDLMHDQLVLPEAWSADKPGGLVAGIQLGAEVSDDLLRSDDWLKAVQGVAPLGRQLDRFGELTPVQDSVSISAASIVDAIDGTLLDDRSIEVRDWFAPAQFDQLGDVARLSSPSYELMDAGVSFGANGVAIAGREVVEAPEGHETSVWEPKPGTSKTYRGVIADRALADVIAASSAATAASGRLAPAVDVPRISIADPRYTAVDRITGTRTGPVASYRDAVAGAGAEEMVVPAHVAGVG